MERRQEHAQAAPERDEIRLREPGEIRGSERFGDLRQRPTAHLDELVERERRHRQGYPATNAALRELLTVHGAGGPRRDDAVLGMVVDEQLDLGLPVLHVLHLIEEQPRLAAFRTDHLVIDAKRLAQARDTSRRSSR
jgi:hypothetical protein